MSICTITAANSSIACNVTNRTIQCSFIEPLVGEGVSSYREVGGEGTWQSHQRSGQRLLVEGLHPWDPRNPAAKAPRLAANPDSLLTTYSTSGPLHSENGLCTPLENMGRNDVQMQLEMSNTGI